MMRYSLIPLCFVFCFLFMETAQAQLSKSERKVWKKKLKATSPAAFKTIVEEHSKFKSEVSGLRNRNSDIESRIKGKDTKIAELTDQIRGLENDLSATNRAALKSQQKPQAESKQPRPRASRKATKGVLFKVQIGAFRNKDLSKYFDNHENFGGETSEEGVQKITLGEFLDYWEADTFKKYLREMGVKDAWVVPYKDGQRVPIKDVLEGVI